MGPEERGNLRKENGEVASATANVCNPRAIDQLQLPLAIEIVTADAKKLDELAEIVLGKLEQVKAPNAGE